MHGLIFQKLQDFVIDISSGETWLKMKKEAGLEDIIFSPTRKYPDEYIEKFVALAQDHFELERDDVLEAFGKHMGPKLIQLFNFTIVPGWTALEIIENTEEYIHKTLKTADPNVDTPKLVVTRISGNELKLEYNSPRKMIALGIGIVKAIGEAFGEQLTITRKDTDEGTTLMIKKQLGHVWPARPQSTM
ncbi:MAG: heme NO-binding domain-containing protein [Cytophagales bacterium]|nr:heme NO-binding domain-containing protein [Cytophagales bacterium]